MVATKSSKSGLVPVRGPKRYFKSWGRFWRDRESSRSETRTSGLKYRNRGDLWDDREVSVGEPIIATSGGNGGYNATLCRRQNAPLSEPVGHWEFEK